jgi:hypothetical protein
MEHGLERNIHLGLTWKKNSVKYSCSWMEILIKEKVDVGDSTNFNFYYVPPFQPLQRVEEFASLLSLQIEMLRRFRRSIPHQVALEIFDNKPLDLTAFPCCIPKKNNDCLEHFLSFFSRSPNHTPSLNKCQVKYLCVYDNFTARQDAIFTITRKSLK